MAIYDAATEAQLASATLPAGTVDSAIGNFRYIDLASPRALETGKEYVIAWYTPTTNERYVDFSDVTVDSLISPTVEYKTNDSGGLVFPGQFIQGNPRIGPNFLFVPEPSTLLLATLGVLGLLGWGRRRRTA